RRHTSWPRDWSSDVCSSDLAAALLYALRNGLYAAASYPVGALSDRYGRRGLLALGYVVGAVVAAGFAAAFAVPGAFAQPAAALEIGRASCRGRVEGSGGRGA